MSENMRVSEKAYIGKNTIIKEGVIIEENAMIGSNCYIDYGAIIKENVTIGDNCFVGSNCVLGEYLSDFFEKFINNKHELYIGDNAKIRSGTIIYGETSIGINFQTGHNATIRENTQIGDNVSIGTLSDIQGFSEIGNFVRVHSNVHICQFSKIKDYVWIFPYTVFTNDKLPPSDNLKGVTVEEGAVICTKSIILPDILIGKEAFIGAGTLVTKDVPDDCIYLGYPGKIKGKTSEIQDKETGQILYPWRNRYKRL
ncbi:N-acetyltransferase [Aminipila butyrica]|uniref:N-acetyltransferase n=1 Tax=Aminipila butyrica TaxID=433296 RepID=A0A858BSV7_9FIRM|nr:N-acetyltransferase [Aminipila butyrica]QIB68168.1 N-acetyltransferase [Aminipila butyrica]